MADLTNSKPKDTYHRLVQVESGSESRFQRFQNGLGSPILSASFYSLEVANDIYVRSGSVYAQSFITTYTTSSTLFQSGSTKFGDSSDDTHDFTGSIRLSGSLVTTSSLLDFSVPRVTNNTFGNEISMTELRTTILAKTSGSGINGNISVEDNSSGRSIIKLYADTIQVGSYTGSIIAFGNSSTTTYLEGSTNVQGSLTLLPNRVLTLRPSQTLGLVPETGSIVVSGSSMVYYDGNVWQYLQTGSYALSSSLNVATASINVNETNISTLTSKTGSYALTSSLNVATASIAVNETNIGVLTFKTGSYALTSSLNVATASITVNETNINTLTAATSSYALDSEVEHINSVTSSFALSSALTVATSSITVNEANINNLTLFTGSYSSSASDTYVSIAKLKAIVTGSADFATFQTNILSL